ncbi:DUF1573 domain-containing protein [bacterium]|nr:DUF1573 domain-containing protein [bacterium]MCI0602044.1 DUF1573 domain-containing protein [bacterium]
MQIRFSVIFLFIALVGISIAETQGAPRAVFGEKTYTFGQVKQGEIVVHKFQVKNEGTAPLILDKVEFNLPGLTSRFKPEIPPGAEGSIQIELNTTYFTGEMDMEAELHSNDPVQPKFTFTLSGVIEPVIEVSPLPGAYISLYADENKDQTLRVINHEEQPLKITNVELHGTHFKANLKEVQTGKIFELTITVPAGTAPGRYEESLLLHTNHPKFSAVPVGVNLFVMRDLFANPESVDFTGIDLSLLNTNPDLIENLYETVRLRKREGDFEIKSIQTDVPFLKITQSPASGRSSMFELNIAVVKEKLAAGKISGSVRVATDDKKFPEIVIPVEAEIK